MAKALILMIDRSATTRSMYRDCFRHHGYEVVEAEDAADGLRLFARWDPQLVVTELDDDPGWLDAIRMLRALVPGRHTPVILCSTRIETSTPVLPEGLEVDMALPKPISPRELLTQASDLLARHGLEATTGHRRPRSSAA